MRRLVPVLALALVAPAAAEPEADPSAPVLRYAKARLVGDAVQIEARVEIEQDGPLPPPGLSNSISLPTGAVVTGATVTVGHHTQRMQLLERTVADKRLEILSKPATPSGGRMWAVRIDSEFSDIARIEIAAARAGRVRIDFTLEVPACFADDARNILVPADWTSAMRGKGTLVSTETARVLGERCGIDGTSWFAFADTALARKPAGQERIGTHTQRLSLGPSDVARVEVSAAKRLSDIPIDLHTVLVVDHSRSMTTEDLETQRAAIDAYLRAAPSTRVQLVGYARDAHTLLPGWTLASQAGARIDRELRALAPRNGSNVDRGLAVASTLLDNVRGTRRIVLFTDDRLADRITFDVSTLAAAVPPNILVHVVSLHGVGERVARNTGHVLEPIALATTGAAFAVDRDASGVIDALPLVRPISFDNISISGPEWTPLQADVACPDELAEGASCAWIADGTSTSKPIVVEGWLWGTKVVREISPDRRAARSLARRLVTWTSLPSHLLEGVQAAAEAVNDAWSLVATWGPRGGYGDLETYGTIGIGSFSTHSNHHSIVGVGKAGERPRPDELIAQLGPVVRACKPRSKVFLVVELTIEEIVDLSLAFTDERDRALSDCITNGVWDASLALATPPSHATVTIEI